MVVRALRLHNFRNFGAQELLLPPGLIALTGENGAGKTNLLESICVLATTKSPLIDRDRELMRWSERTTRLNAEVELGGGREARRLEYAWRLEGNTVTRELKAGGVRQASVAEWMGQLQVVAFFPHDLVILTGEPEERRRFLNMELGKTRPVYFADMVRYRRALQQRNALLRYFVECRIKRLPPAGESEIGSLTEWNRQVISYGSRILAERAQFFRELAPLLTEVHARLSGREEPFSIDYVPGLSALRAGGARNFDGENFSAVFAQSQERDYMDDMRRGTTASGPHRDDLVFRLGDMELRRYGSQGQQRLAVLALKLALAHWVRASTSESPVLLLDDALSELDPIRRRRLLDEASGFDQTVVTATDSEFVGECAAHFVIEGGQVVSGQSAAPEAQNGVLE